MSQDNTTHGLAEGAHRNLAEGWALRGVLILTACLLATSACRQTPDPLEKAFQAVGGKEALLDLKGFSFSATGDRFEAAQGPTPGADPEKASSFTVTLLCDVENDRLSFDWQWRIFHPLRGELAYRDVLTGELGFRRGNDSVFNPPGTTSEVALPALRIGGLRREFRLLNPHLYLRAAAASEDVSSIKPEVELEGHTHHVVEVADMVVPVELLIDAERGLVSKLRTLQNDHIWGDVVTEVSYSNWSTAEGSSLMVPHGVELVVAGTTLHQDTRTNWVVNPEFATDAFSLPTEPRTQVDPEAMERGERSAQYHTRWQALGLPADVDQKVVNATPLAGDSDVQHLTGGTVLVQIGLSER